MSESGTDNCRTVEAPELQAVETVDNVELIETSVDSTETVEPVDVSGVSEQVDSGSVEDNNNSKTTLQTMFESMMSLSEEVQMQQFNIARRKPAGRGRVASYIIAGG